MVGSNASAMRCYSCAPRTVGRRGVYLYGGSRRGVVAAGSRLEGRSGDSATRHKTLDTGHDLRALLSLVSDLGLLAGSDDRRDLEARVQRISRLWYNNLRFASSKFIETRWLKLGEFGRRQPPPVSSTTARQSSNGASCYAKRRIRTGAGHRAELRRPV